MTSARAGRLLPWLVVALGFAGLALSFSTRASLGLVMPAWEREFGWSRGFMSQAAALGLIVMAAASPFAGHVVDRLGPRPLLAGGLTAVGAGMLLVSVMDQGWQLVLAFAVLAGVGFGSVSTHVTATSIAQFFERDRGLATGIATAGATAGQLFVMPLLAVLVAAGSWRWSYAALSAACFALAALSLVVLRGTGGRPQKDRGAVAHEAVTQRIVWLFRQKAFHILLWSFVICGFTTTGVIETHLLPYAALCGFPPVESAAAYGVLAGVNFGGMVLSGWLSDRVHRPLLLGTIYVARGLAFVLLMAVGNDLSLLFAFAAMFGLFNFSTMPVTASLVASHLGLNVMGLAMGLIAAGHALGGAAGAFLGGWLYDSFARYDGVWLASVALAVAAGLLVFLLPETPERRGRLLRPALA